MTAADRRALRGPLAAAALVLAVETATHLVDFRVLDFRSRLLDSQYEWSWSHLVSTAMFGAGACACALGAVRRRECGRVWSGTAALLAFLCVDGATRLHDGFTLWPVVYVPALGALAAGVLVLSNGTRLAVVARAGLVVLGASLAVHVLGHEAVKAIGWGPQAWGYQVKVAFKEGLELAGWTLLVPTLGRLAIRVGGPSHAHLLGGMVVRNAGVRGTGGEGDRDRSGRGDRAGAGARRRVAGPARGRLPLRARSGR